MRYLLSFGVCCAVLCGCSSAPEKQVSDADRANSLAQAAAKIQNDPNASDQAKGVAAGAIQQVQDNQQVNRMLDGK